MGYLLYSLSFTLLIISTALYLTRSFWLSLLPTMNFPGSSYLYARLPSSFASDMENGFSSSAFDLSGNISAGDSRAGLDDSSKKEIQKIMKKRRVNFDEARRIYTEGRFAKNGIAPDGRPRDPKFVSFS